MESKNFVDSPYLVSWDQTWSISDALSYPEETQDKKQEKARLEELKKGMIEQQKRLFAEKKQALLVVFQAMDAAGKDGTINAVFSGLNPQGCSVQSFKRPTPLELSHDYLWRVHQHTPQKGWIQVFNRSHYEEVLVTSVFPEILTSQKLPPNTMEAEFAQRFDQIKQFESLLSQTGTRIIKFWLNISKEEQRRRLLSRTEESSKNWKHEAADLRMRAHWDDFMQAYQRSLVETSTPNAPWYAIPADNKPFMRSCVADIIHRTLLDMNPQYPTVSHAEKEQIEKDRQTLLKDNI